MTKMRLSIFLLFFVFILQFSAAYAFSRSVDEHYLIQPGFLGFMIVSLIGAAFLFSRFRLVTFITGIVSFVALGFYPYRNRMTGTAILELYLYSLLLMVFLYIIIELARSYKKNEKSQEYQAPGVILLVNAAILAGMFFVSGSTDIIIETSDAIQCRMNLGYISITLEMYREDEGRYPDSLDRLTPLYWKNVPCCAYGSYDRKTINYYRKHHNVNLEGYGYKVSADRLNYTMWCDGDNHPRLEENYPRCTSKDVSPRLHP